MCYHKKELDLCSPCPVDSFPVPVVPSIATVVIIISVCMLVFVVAMGVYRVRIAHQHFIQETEAAKEAEMDWDDSALTITVNPMEVNPHGGLGLGWGASPSTHLSSSWVKALPCLGPPSPSSPCLSSCLWASTSLSTWTDRISPPTVLGLKMCELLSSHEQNFLKQAAMCVYPLLLP